MHPADLRADEDADQRELTAQLAKRDEDALLEPEIVATAGSVRIEEEPPDSWST